MTSCCWAVVRIRPWPYSSARPAIRASWVPRGAADPQREADRVAAVDLLGQPACPRAPVYRSGAGPSGSGCPGSPSPAPRGTARCPSRRAGTSAGAVPGAGGSRGRGTRAVTPAHTSADPSGLRRTRRAAGRTSGWWTARRRPTGRNRACRPGPITPTNATSLISWLVQCCAHPEIDGLVLARQVGELRVADVAVDDLPRSAGVASSTSSSATPASGQPSMTRGVSPQASVVSRPTASSRAQISGTSSIRIQCSWMFCRSVMSAMSRPNSVAMLRDDAQLLGAQRPAVDADADHEVAVLELLGLQHRGLTARDARGALGVEPVPAEPAAQVGRVDAVEARFWIDVDDALRTLSPSSSCLTRSFLFSGSR